MTTATTLTAPHTGEAEILGQCISQDISLGNPVAIENYLTQHPSLRSLLPEICKSVRTAFGPTIELFLKVYEDPEIDDRYLTLYIRQDRYEPNLLDRIDAIAGEFANALELASGFLLLTTDFRRPGENHVV